MVVAEFCIVLPFFFLNFSIYRFDDVLEIGANIYTPL